MSAITTLELISQTGLKDVGYTLISLGTVSIVVRYIIRIVKRRLWQWEDSFVLMAFLCYLALCITYIVVCPAMYRLLHFEEDGYKPYPQLVSDGDFLTKIFFPNTLLFWCCLWLVKFSFMAQCKRIILRQRRYTIAWWCILAFICLTFIGCVASEFMSCRSLHDWFTFGNVSNLGTCNPAAAYQFLGQCSTPRDARAATISLYFSFAVDVVTDLMIIALPFKVLWNLQITKWKKFRVLSFFGIVALGIGAAVTRVTAVIVTSKGKQPSPSWLALWAMIESFIAILVACLPAVGSLFAPVAKPISYKYDYNGQDTSPSATGRRGLLNASKSRHRTKIEAVPSDEVLRYDEKGVIMTTTVDAHSSRISSLRANSDTSERHPGVVV